MIEAAIAGTRSTKAWIRDKLQRIKTAPGVWQSWAYGRDSKGCPVPGRLSWAKRAREYDIMLAAEYMLARREKMGGASTGTCARPNGDRLALCERAKRMQQGCFFREVTEKKSDKDGQTVMKDIFGPTNWGEHDIRSHYKLGSELRRRGVGQPPKIGVPAGLEVACPNQDGYNPEELKEKLRMDLRFG